MVKPNNKGGQATELDLFLDSNFEILLKEFKRLKGILPEAFVSDLSEEISLKDRIFVSQFIEKIKEHSRGVKFRIQNNA